VAEDDFTNCKTLNLEILFRRDAFRNVGDDLKKNLTTFNSWGLISRK
jgi:hypothetical protein